MKIVEGHLYGRIIDILRNGSKLMLLATGMTFVLATGGTDISVGSVMAISGAIACSIVANGGNVAVAVLVAILAGVVAGAWNGMLVAKVKIQPIVATMILMVAGRGIAQLITNGKIITINSDSYYFINGGYILGLPFPIFIVAFVVLIAMLFTKKTAFGLFLESTGINPVSSRFAGINVDRIKWLVYTFCGVMAAVAGLIESAGIKGADCNNAGLLIEMDAILAVAIGGTSLNGGRFSIPASLAVSYTHLDVYKRQKQSRSGISGEIVSRGINFRRRNHGMAIDEAGPVLPSGGRGPFCAFPAELSAWKAPAGCAQPGQPISPSVSPSKKQS